MMRRLSTSSRDFDHAFTAWLQADRAAAGDVRDVVAAILAGVRGQGDAALLRYTEEFDRVRLDLGALRVSAGEIEAARRGCDPAVLEALAFAAGRIRAYHERQRPSSERFIDAAGAELGSRWTAIGAVGLYVPGGTASYPSSVLMNAVPAAIAGVKRIVMAVPAPGGHINPAVLAAAALAGVHEIYKIGGAQAIAALAYGTASIAPVDKIVGPGNAYVAEAKRQVFGTVGIDTIAGPSEILVVADRHNDPAWVAADLLSQAEHDEAAQSILITDDPAFAGRVELAIQTELEGLARAETARRSLEAHGAIILVRTFEEALPLIDRIAAEHVEILLADPEPFAERIRNAGAIFIGGYTPEVIGDYVAGTNHVLPTGRSARYSSGLSVLDFMKRTSIVKLGPESFSRLAPAALTLSAAEGLGAHGRSLTIRSNRV